MTPQPLANSGYTEASRDNVDMSMIGRIMAQSVKDLASDDLPRPEKTEPFKNLVAVPTRFSDSIIDKIFRQMIG